MMNGVMDGKSGDAGLDMGRVDPRVGSGRVGSGPNFRQIWRIGSGRNFLYGLFFICVG